MRVSVVILCAVFTVVVSSATTARGVTKASKPKSAYTYLRTVRGKNSCASGSCPFWERHGRSFASLRCYSREYQDCTCLHRMCFSSCMFTRDECNKEMVSCLQQICPRCMPATSRAMCAVYDSMAVRVADALSVFACYPCCPNLANSPSNNTSPQNGMVMITTTIRPMNSGNTIINAVAGAGSTNTMPQPGSNVMTTGNTGSNQISGGNQGNTNGNSNGFGGVFSGSGTTTYNGNMRNNSNSNSNSNNRPVQNQQIRQVTRPTTRPMVTTRRTSTGTSRKPTATTRRPANVNNANKSTVRNAVQAPKKPQTTY